MTRRSERSRVLSPPGDGKGHATSLDARLAEFADTRHGVVTTDELLRAGYTEARIEGLHERGTLHRQYRGVHSVGRPTLTPAGRALAATLAVGMAGRPKQRVDGSEPDTGAAGRTGATLQDLTSWWPPTPTVATARAVRELAGVRVIRPARLPASDLTLVDGISCLTVTRLILDAAQARDGKLLERLWRQAKRTQRLDEVAIVQRMAGRRGQDLVAALLAEDEPDTTNTFERTVYGLLDGLGLPEPKREHRIEPFVLDFFLEELLWCLEADSWTWHGSYGPFVSDRDRDRELHAEHGIWTTRITHEDATQRPERLRRQLAATAARRAREVGRALS